MHMRTKKIVLAALLSALIFVGTSMIKLPTPTGGYIHPGDGFVLLCGLLMGPLWGGLAAGIGSMLSDLLGGYPVYAPATFVIKALVAVVCALTCRRLPFDPADKNARIRLIFAGALGEICMVAGYFVFEIFLLSILNHTDVSAGVIAALAGIVPNLIQGGFGIVIMILLYPVLQQASERYLAE